MICLKNSKHASKHNTQIKHDYQLFIIRHIIKAGVNEWVVPALSDWYPWKNIVGYAVVLRDVNMFVHNNHYIRILHY